MAVVEDADEYCGPVRHAPEKDELRVEQRDRVQRALDKLERNIEEAQAADVRLKAAIRERERLRHKAGWVRFSKRR